jgi:signal transduction histidine kinase
MKQYICIIILLITFQNNRAEVANDSTSLLMKQLNNTGPESRGPVFLKLATYFQQRDTLKAIHFANEAICLANKTNQPLLLARSYTTMGDIYNHCDKYKPAIVQYIEALTIFKKINDKPEMADVYYKTGLLYFFLASYEASLINYQQAATLYEELSDKKGLACVYQNIGQVHFDLDNPDKALEYYYKALEINNNLKQQNKIAALLQNIGIVYFTKDDNNLALNQYNQSYNIFKEIGDHEGIASSLLNIGLIYEVDQEYEKTLSYYTRALQEFEAIKYQRGIAFACYNLGSVYRAMKNNTKSLAYFERSKTVSEQYALYENLADVYLALANYYEASQDYHNATDYYKKHYTLKDSLSNKQVQENIANIESKFDLKLREQELSKQNAELKQQSYQRITLITIIVLLLIFSITISIAYRKRNKAELTLQKHQEKLEEIIEQRTTRLKLEIAERRNAEESDRLKTAFLSNMSHEIRTPMNAIIAFSNFLRDPELPHDRRTEYLNYINSSGASLLQLIDDIIDSAKIEAGQLKINKVECNIHKLCEELFESFLAIRSRRGKECVELQYLNHNENKHIVIMSDYVRLRQIISNLLDNAFKFTSKGNISFGFVDKGNYIEFSVKDSGCGIPADKLDLIFERFVQVDITARRYGGAGLGLNICKNLVEILDGRMWAKSVLGEGSEFTFTLPYIHKELLTMNSHPFAQHLAKESLYNWKDKHVLVAEDEDLNFKVLEVALQRTQVNLIRVTNGIQAIEECRKNKNINLILMDIQMPKMNGLDATREIKQINTKLPIIAQTAFAMNGEKEKCIEAGCDDYIAKPIDLIELISKVSKYLN